MPPDFIQGKALGGSPSWFTLTLGLTLGANLWPRLTALIVVPSSTKPSLGLRRTEKLERSASCCVLKRDTYQGSACPRGELAVSSRTLKRSKWVRDLLLLPSRP